MFVSQVKIAPSVKVSTKPVVVNRVNKWVKPVVVDSRLGFEVTAYQFNEWVKPVVVDSRLGFEVTAYAGSITK